MPVYRPSELILFLKELGVTAKKHLSQNFLIDGNIIRNILAAAQLPKSQNISNAPVIIEIGPGPGALTQALLDTGSHVIAIEKDPAFAGALKRWQTPDFRLEIFQEDFLQFPLELFLKDRLAKGQKAKVIANLPYHLTAPIIARLAPLNELITSLTLMIQKEVADRLVAQKNTPQYSSMTIFSQFFAVPKYCFTIEPACFFPKPKVRSAMVHFLLKPPPLLEFTEFFQMTRSAFQKRRKMLRSSLKERYGCNEIEAALTNLGLSVEARPEMLALEEFIALFRLLSAS